MGRLRNNHQGFAVVEAILIIVILAILGFTGYYVYHAKQNTDKTLTNTANSSPATQPKAKSGNAVTKTTTADPYAGWKTYTLSKEGLAFKYPTNLTLKDSTQATDIGDTVTLTGTDNFAVDIDTGPGAGDFTCPFGGCNIKQSDQVSFLGKTGYLDAYDGDSSGENVLSISLSQSQTAVGPSSYFLTKNIAYQKPNPSASDSYLAIEINWDADESTAANNTKSLAAVNSDVQYKDAKLVVESMKY